MGLVERIFGKIGHIVVDFIGNLLGNTIADTSGNALFFITINKVLALLGHNGGLFLGHCTAYQIASTQRIAAQIPDDLHNLLLIYDTAVGRLQNRFELRTVIGDLVGMVFALDILGDKVHRARTVQGNTGDDILKALWLQLLHERFHTRTLKLEHALTDTLSDHVKHLRIVIIDRIHINVESGALLDISHGILDHGQGTQSQKVHF